MSDSRSKDQCSICGVSYINGKQACNCNAGPLQPPSSKTVVHFYAGWCGKTLCAAAEVGPISSIKADDVTCETCKTMLMPARMIQPLVVDGDELAKIEDGWGDPAGTYLKYRGQVWINDGWLDESKVRALRDWLTTCLPVETPQSAASKQSVAGLSKYAREWLTNLRRESGGYPAEVLRHVNILEEDVLRAERIADHLGEENTRLRAALELLLRRSWPRLL